MSTIPKAHQELINKCESPEIRLAMEFGYQLATDGREELEKENERMKLTIKRRSESMIEQRKQITALQSQCTEKDQEIEALKSVIKDHDKELQEAFKEGQNSIGHAGHW